MSELENKVNLLHNALHRALSMLVKPADESNKGELHEILELNIQNAMKELKLDDFSDMQPLHGIKCTVNANSSVRWKFVCVTLHILLSMKVTLKLLSAMPAEGRNKGPKDLLSVAQQKTIRTCLQFVVSMGLLPSLLPGVGVALAARCSSAANLKDEELLLLEHLFLQKYERLAAVTRGLLVCAENPSLRQIIVSHHLGDLMAALSQLSFVPLKKPAEPPPQASTTVVATTTVAATAVVASSGSEAAQRETNSTNGQSEEFVMTPELWVRLQRDRSQFRIYYLSFIWEMYQPLVIRELLILHGAAGLKRLQNCARTNPPTWLKKSCIILLIHCIMRPKGVSSLIRAICDADPDTGTDWSKLETVVNLITTVHTSDPEKYNKNICSQLVEILKGSDKLPGSVGQLQLMIAVRCIEALYKKDEELIRRHVLDIILKPLLTCCVPPSSIAWEDSEVEEDDTIDEMPIMNSIEGIGLLDSTDDEAGPLLKIEEKMEILEESETEQAEESEQSTTAVEVVPSPDATDETDKESRKLIVPEEELTLCIVNMHRLFAEHVSGSSEPALPPVSYASFTPVLFALYKRVYSSACHYKSKVEDLLSRILCNFRSEVFGDVFRSFIFGDESGSDGLLQMNPLYEFCFASGGGVEVRERDGIVSAKGGKMRVPSPPSGREAFENTADCVFELLNNADKTGEITTNLFLALLHVFFEPLDNAQDDGGATSFPNPATCRIKVPTECDSERTIIAAQLLTALSESDYVKQKIFSDPNYLVRYIFFILEKDARQLAERTTVENGDAASTVSSDCDDSLDEHLFIVLMILSVAVNSSANTPLEGALFESIVEPLKMICDTVANEELRHLASQIYNKVVTHGVITESTVEPIEDVPAKTEKQDDEQQQPPPTTNKNKKKAALAEGKKAADRMLAFSNKDGQKNGEKKTNNAGEKDKGGKPKDGKAAYLKAVVETYDPLIPVRGHGLLELTRLILSGDKEARRNKEEIFVIFQENLNHEDSYIYLAAVNGLAALVGMNPENVMTILIEEYVGMRTKRSKQLEKSPELRMKVGEVLVRVTKALGDMIPVHKDLLLNAFMGATKDPDELIRASSLSNLGTLCKVMKFRVGPILNEIMVCVQSIVKTDPVVEVRRAAILVLTLLLEGLGDDTVSVLKDIILELYRTLKHVYLTENDEVVKLQVQLACEALGKSTLEFITRPRKLEKKICILDRPEI
ncbi:transport and Golgi organization protein 6 homolog isoform X1 [Schistocerca piceifrons]|uniref:transport and Golgi organization protein 6 homolog isoform X1 n=1 Tax=Schistocerca piceifrons TaxID=274613 RepID=UPI001F5E3EFF|nr:transport and Golgi organization protein 6 homolog isoform X1 [Schistocerca piceifrons]XP_049951318.1 transport and Golgi organization protein 6 homolog isoform X1 [Schistocerca serialis cubense]